MLFVLNAQELTGFLKDQQLLKFDDRYKEIKEIVTENGY